MIQKNNSNGNRGLITAEFKKKRKGWKLVRVFDKKNRNIKNSVKKKNYSSEEMNSCFSSFVRAWEKRYKVSKLKLVNELARVSNILLIINNSSYVGTFNLQYKHPSQGNYKNGWLISSAFLDKTNKKNVVNKSLPTKDKSYHATDILSPADRLSATSGKQQRDTVPVQAVTHLSQEENAQNLEAPKIVNLICHNYEGEKRIRVTFTLNQGVKASSTIMTNQNNKIVTFLLNGKNTESTFNNCLFLQTYYESGLFSIDLTEFSGNIKGVKYGSGRNQETSFIDYYY
jgi:hypothetical protein